jgi:hypothetical protein
MSHVEHSTRIEYALVSEVRRAIRGRNGVLEGLDVTTMIRRGLALLAIVCAPGCGGSPTPPSRVAIVTFQVENERFRVQVVGEDQISAARRAQAGSGGRIPDGRIVNGTEVNQGWNWHLVDVSFVEVATELCDGIPSDVEKAGVNFGGGRFCPWTARVVAIDEI